jgi:ABC-type transport system involved in multi-copper enzyme maturation permease subunit
MNPLHLLKLEWSKYSPNGTFRVFAVLYLVSFALIFFLARATGQNMTFTSNGTTSHPLDGLFVYPHDWELLACIGSWANSFVLGSLGVSMITMEFSNKTLRQSIIFGLTRLEVAAAKLVWAGALALVATAFYILLAIGGEILSGVGPQVPPVGSILCFYLQALGYLLLGTLVGLVIRQTALAILAYLAYVLFFETACRWLIYFTVAKTRLLLFLPDQLLSALTPLPIPDSVNHLMNANPATLPLSVTEAAAGALIYLGLFTLFFCRKIQKSDL